MSLDSFSRATNSQTRSRVASDGRKSATSRGLEPPGNEVNQFVVGSHQAHRQGPELRNDQRLGRYLIDFTGRFTPSRGRVGALMSACSSHPRPIGVERKRCADTKVINGVGINLVATIAETQAELRVIEAVALFRKVFAVA